MVRTVDLRRRWTTVERNVECISNGVIVNVQGQAEVQVASLAFEAVRQRLRNCLHTTVTKQWPQSKVCWRERLSSQQHSNFTST